MKLVIETDFMRRSGDKGAIPVMSRTGKVTILQDTAFLNKPKLPTIEGKESPLDNPNLMSEDFIFNQSFKRLRNANYDTFRQGKRDS